MSLDFGDIKTPKVTGYQSRGGGCKGICTRYKAGKPVKGGRYNAGQVRCQTCEIYMKIEGLRCPCCKTAVRTRPRNLRYKERYRAKMESRKEQSQ